MTRKNQNKWKKVGVLFAFLFGFTIVYGDIHQAYATTSSELKEQQQQVEAEKQEIEELKETLEDALGDMNSELYTVSSDLSELQEQIAENELAIEETTALLDESTALATEQYENMKLRIQYMYENGQDLSWMSLFEAENFADFVNRVEYMSAMTSYDRDMLAEYQETMELVASYKEELENAQANLLAQQEELETAEASLLATIQSQKNEIAYSESAIAGKEEESAALAEQIAAMEAYEQSLNEQKVPQNGGTVYNNIKALEERDGHLFGTPLNVAPGEAELFAALVYCEAGGESYAGQLAVASVVANRVNCTYYPNSITGVIYQANQFSPVASGKLALVLENGLATQSCINAANAAISGGVSGNWLAFYAPRDINNPPTPGDVIDRQVFY